MDSYLKPESLTFLDLLSYTSAFLSLCMNEVLCELLASSAGFHPYLTSSLL